MNIPKYIKMLLLKLNKVDKKIVTFTTYMKYEKEFDRICTRYVITEYEENKRTGRRKIKRQGTFGSQHEALIFLSKIGG